MYAVWSRQDAGTQWRAKAGGRENAGTVVPRVSPAGRQGQAMEDVRIRYRTEPREGAGVVQRMAEEELGRTEQGVGQGERKGKPRAVLGRRVEPYSEDIQGFKQILDCTGKSETVNMCIVNMVRKKTQDENNASSKRQDEVFKIDATDYEYVKMDKKGFYQNSVNVWVKRKMYEHPERSCEYAGRVLDVKPWNIAINRKWIKEGNENIKNAGLSVGVVTLPGMDGKGQFRLVGLESLAKDKSGVFKIQKETYAYSKVNRSHQSDKQGQRVIRFMKLKKENFNKNDKINLYQAAFTDGSVAMDDKNFIAYVVHHKVGESLLRSRQVLGRREKPAFIGDVAPTVLAQEMEQLDEAGYLFATISEGEEVKKVIALPEGAARDIRTEITRTAPQPTPSETPEG